MRSASGAFAHSAAEVAKMKPIISHSGTEPPQTTSQWLCETIALGNLATMAERDPLPLIALMARVRTLPSFLRLRMSFQ